MVSDLQSNGHVGLVTDVERLNTPEWQACDVEAHWLQRAVVLGIAATVYALSVVEAAALPIAVVITCDVAHGEGRQLRSRACASTSMWSS